MSSPADVTVSQAERVERLRAQLQGRQRVGSRSTSKAVPAPAMGLLYGVMLRGAARLEAGLELTDLEAQMVEFLRPLASQEEICELGRVFREEQAAHASRMFPDVLNERPVEQGYAFEDLVRDLPGLRAQIAAEPNLSLVDLDRLGEGAALDSKEFTEGLAAYGRGVTVVTASDHRPDARAGEKPEHVSVALNSFRCQRASNELGADEIYWALAASSDRNVKKNSITREYGSVQTGSYRVFDAGTTLFAGQVDKFLTAHVICWEADHSPSGWLAEMGGTMVRIADALFLMADKMAEYGGHFPVPEYHDLIDYLEVAGMIALAIAGLIKMFTNHDDQVLERTFVIDRAALGKWANDHGTITNWEFDGGSGGHHTLTLKAASAINSRPRITSLIGWPPDSGNTWSPDVAFPSGTMSGAPALAAYESKLYCVIPGSAGSGSLWWSTLEAGTWTPFAQIPGVRDARWSPTLAVHDRKLYCAYTKSNNVYATAFNAATSSWSALQLIGENISLGTPALAKFGTSLLCVVRGPENKLFWSDRRADRPSWSAFRPFPNGTTCDSPAVGYGSGGGTPYCVVRSEDGTGLYWSKYTANWSPFEQLPLGSASAPPALAFSAGKLYIMFRAPDVSEELLWSTFDGTTWSPVTKHPTATTADAPALAHHNDPNDTSAPYGRLYCAFRG